MSDFGREVGRRVFGRDASAYDAARPPYPELVYDVLRRRCGLRPGTRVLEIGAGTGIATRRLVELGAEVVAVEPDPAMAALLPRVEVRVAPISRRSSSKRRPTTSRSRPPRSTGSTRPPGCAGWSTHCGRAGGSPVVDDVRRSRPVRRVPPRDEPRRRRAAHGPVEGRRDAAPTYAVDREARLGALEAAGFVELADERTTWDAVFDPGGIRGLYGTFSPIGRLADAERERGLDGVERVAAEEFGGRVVRPFITAIYSARRPG